MSCLASAVICLWARAAVLASRLRAFRRAKRAPARMWTDAGSSFGVGLAASWRRASVTCSASGDCDSIIVVVSLADRVVGSGPLSFQFIISRTPLTWVFNTTLVSSRLNRRQSRQLHGNSTLDSRSCNQRHNSPLCQWPTSILRASLQANLQYSASCQRRIKT